MSLRMPALLILILAAAAAVGAGPQAPAQDGDPGRLWREASAPFRRRPKPARAQGHLSGPVAEAARKRRTLRSPFTPPAGDLPLPVKGRPAAAKTLGTAEGSLLLDEAEQQLKTLAESMDAGPPDRALKSAQALGARLAAVILASKSQRDRAAAITAALAGLQGRLERRAAFAALNPRVRFIIFSPEKGRSLAVVNQRVLHEGDTLVPGVTVGGISQHQVTFDLGGEQVAVGLK